MRLESEEYIFRQHLQALVVVVVVVVVVVIAVVIIVVVVAAVVTSGSIGSPTFELQAWAWCLDVGFRHGPGAWIRASGPGLIPRFGLQAQVW